MVVSGEVFNFGLSAGTKIAEVTDSSTAVTHGTPVTVKAKSLTYTENFFSEKQRGDGKSLDVYSEFDFISGQLVMAKENLEALALITGQSVETTGNNKKIEYDASNYPGYWALGYRHLYDSDGDTPQKAYYFNKCKVTGVDRGAQDRAYGDVTVNFEAIPREYDYLWEKDEHLAAAAAITFTDLP